MTHAETMEYLGSFTKAGAPVADLSRFKGLMAALGEPYKKLKCIHVAGTNGKGSVCEYVCLGLMKNGFHTGKFTSPYINFVEERIQLDNVPISREDFAHYIELVKTAAEKTGCKDYSQFEILCAAAFLYYADKNCDYAVIEVGIGGTLDCTNVIYPEISVITTVDLDHCSILGNTPAEIAVHKAGIIKENRPAVSSPFQHPEVISVLKNRAKEMNAPLTVPENEDIKILDSTLEGTGFTYKNEKFRTKMCGKHQAVNAVAAIETLRLLNVSEEDIRFALENAAVPARTERFPNGWLIDGAHNVSGAAAVSALLKENSDSKTLVTGMLKTKDWEGALRLFLPLFDSVVAADFFSPDAVPAEKIVQLAKQAGKPCVKAETPDDAVRLAEETGNRLKMVCGSLYLCGVMRKELGKQQ